MSPYVAVYWSQAHFLPTNDGVILVMRPHTALCHFEFDNKMLIL